MPTNRVTLIADPLLLIFFLDIYRLDRLTSGVLIMGKTSSKTKELEDQVLHRHVYKEYVARVLGKFPE